jgi:hypothetical protein
MRTGIALLAGLILAFTAVSACSEESKVPLSDVPKVGLAAVKALFPAAEIQGAAKETEDGKTVFEVTLRQMGRNIDVTVGTDGAIQLVEKEISAGDLPALVRKSLETKYPKATYRVVEQVSSMKDGKQKLDFFEAQLVTADKATHEVQVLPDGSIKAEEKKSDAND